MATTVTAVTAESVRMAQWPAGEPSEIDRLRTLLDGNNRAAAKEIVRLRQENDSLRRQLGKWQRDFEISEAAIEQTWRPEVAALRGEVARLQALVEAQDRATAEVAWLRMVFAQIQQWDSLNPPDPQSDFPWLRRLVDNALVHSEALDQATTPASGEES